MRISNRRAVKFLLDNDFEEVWLKSHTKYHDNVYTKYGKYKALDVFNLWDGIALKKDLLYFLQIKTNAWAKEKDIIDWCTKYNEKGLVINVKLINDDWKVFVRYYD